MYCSSYIIKYQYQLVHMPGDKYGSTTHKFLQQKLKTWLNIEGIMDSGLGVLLDYDAHPQHEIWGSTHKYKVVSFAPRTFVVRRHWSPNCWKLLNCMLSCLIDVKYQIELLVDARCRIVSQILNSHVSDELSMLGHGLIIFQVKTRVFDRNIYLYDIFLMADMERAEEGLTKHERESIKGSHHWGLWKKLSSQSLTNWLDRETGSDDYLIKQKCMVYGMSTSNP